MLGDVRLFLLQSEHILLGSNFNSDLMVAWFFAARSAAGFGGRLDMVSLLCVHGWPRKVSTVPEVSDCEGGAGGFGWRELLSRSAIQVDFGSEVGIKGVLEADVCVCLYRLQILGRVECAPD